MQLIILAMFGYFRKKGELQMLSTPADLQKENKSVTFSRAKK